MDNWQSGSLLSCHPVLALTTPDCRKIKNKLLYGALLHRNLLSYFIT